MVVARSNFNRPLMSVASVIGVSEELLERFSSAVETKSTRFLIVSIQNGSTFATYSIMIKSINGHHAEKLVHDGSVEAVGSLEEDLQELPQMLGETNAPAYILVRLDDPTTAWLLIAYVPETAKVRDKVSFQPARGWG